MNKMRMLADKYRLPILSTPEELETGWDKVLNYDERIVVAGHCPEGYYGAIYTYVSSLDHSSTAMLCIDMVSEQTFPDNGGALMWAMMNVDRPEMEPLDELIFFRTNAEYKAYNEMKEKADAWMEAELAHQYGRFLSAYQIIEEGELEGAYEAWKKEHSEE